MIIVSLINNVEKYGRAVQTTDDNVILRRKGAICMPDNQGKNTDMDTDNLMLFVFF